MIEVATLRVQAEAGKQVSVSEEAVDEVAACGWREQGPLARGHQRKGLEGRRAAAERDCGLFLRVGARHGGLFAEQRPGSEWERRRPMSPFSLPEVKGGSGHDFWNRGRASLRNR